jgi:CRP-like cAMP-binding protein
MSSPDAAHNTVNRLLNSLTREERERLSPHLRPVTLSVGEVVFRADEPIQRVYFPDSGVVSIVTTSRAGESIEIGMVGYEGVAGLAVFLGDGIAHNRSAVVQVESGSMMMESDVVRQEFKRSGQFHGVLLRYTQARLTQVSQSVFCQSYHRIDKRLARWLLECQWRTRSGEFNLTQDYLSEVLGIRRPGVTVALGRLKGKGVIDQSRGFIKILDQEGLESSACECFEIIRAEFERLFSI